jgi:uncharacterized membrane protein
MSEEALVLTSHPYRSLGPAGYRALMSVVIGVNVIGAIVFAIAGAWPVSGFLGLDVLALYLALRFSYAQARAFERISISSSSFTVERCDARGNTSMVSLPAYWARVSFEGDDTGGEITVRSHGKSIAVGEHLPGPERQHFADTLKQALFQARQSVPGSQS